MVIFLPFLWDSPSSRAGTSFTLESKAEVETSSLMSTTLCILMALLFLLPVQAALAVDRQVEGTALVLVVTLSTVVEEKKANNLASRSWETSSSAQHAHTRHDNPTKSNATL